MKIYGDYHTHTLHSHGKGSIEDNCKKAVEAGLKEIAITDHGFSHVLYRVKRDKLFGDIKREIEEVRKKFPEIKILLGIEANLMGLDGTVDLEEEDIEKLDIIVCGVHKFLRNTRFRDEIFFFLPNLCGFSTKKMITKNTDAYIKMIEKYPIDIISHLNLGIRSNVKEIAKAAKHFGTYIELNGKKIVLTDEEIMIIANEGAEFILNSDAHSAERVGDFSVCIERAEKVGVPKEQIANWGRIPRFRKQKIIHN